MNNIPPIPESISHKKLNTLFVNVKKDFSNCNEIKNNSTKEENHLEELLTTWSNTSKDLLKSLSQHKNQLESIKTSKSLLSLGAMEAYINMAMQALKSSEEEN